MCVLLEAGDTFSESEIGALLGFVDRAFLEVRVLLELLERVLDGFLESRELSLLGWEERELLEPEVLV